MSKYNDLVNIIESLRNEAPQEYKRYHPKEGDVDANRKSLSRTYLHLFLKVKFGLVDFNSRERYITDDPGDAGIDAYYIDKDNKVLYFLQSKFRHTNDNFENKDIALEELLSMDITRILDGEIEDDKGHPYNAKIQELVNELSEISDTPRYDIEVIVLANVKDSLKSKVKRIIGGFKVEIYNNQRVYNELVFPLVSGTYYNTKEIKITLNVEKESAGHRIQYYPKTEFGDCTVNLLYVPTLEIAKILSKFKNSILRFNPRSYLELVRGSVNEKIASSIYDIKTNEFALFNNGITMLSDETIYSDKVGKKNKAEVVVTNPQIINGGQTAYTLSLILESCKTDLDFNVFEGKEVLLKIISFNDEESRRSNSEKLKLIEEISVATNQQSPVYEADRRANDRIQVQLQELIFKDFGLYYERKKGEFGDGLSKKYISRNQLIDRETFLRICLSVKGEPSRGRSASAYKLFEKKIFDSIIADETNYRKYVYAYLAYVKIFEIKSESVNVLNLARYSVACVVAQRYCEDLPLGNFEESVKVNLQEVISEWPNFEKYVRTKKLNRDYYFKEVFDKETGEKTIETNWAAYYKGRTLNNDLKEYFGY